MIVFEVTDVFAPNVICATQNAVAFLNNDCKMVHANLAPSSLFVTPGGDWKLGGFDLAYSYSEDIPQSSRLHADILPAQYRSPELGKRNWSAIEKAAPWATDAWSLGCVIYEAFNKDFSKQQQLGSPAAIPRTLVDKYKQLLLVDPASRLNPLRVLESKFFDNEVVNAVAFVDSLPIKSDEEKQTFFADFAARVDSYPEVRYLRLLCIVGDLPSTIHFLLFACIAFQRTLKHKILPELIKSLEFGAVLVSFPVVLSSGAFAYSKLLSQLSLQVACATRVCSSQNWGEAWPRRVQPEGSSHYREAVFVE